MAAVVDAQEPLPSQLPIKSIPPTNRCVVAVRVTLMRLCSCEYQASNIKSQRNPSNDAGDNRNIGTAVIPFSTAGI